MKNHLLFICFSFLFSLSTSLAFSQAAPAFEWANRAGNIKNDAGGSIAVDVNGNSYVTGYFENSITFGSTTLTSTGATDIFMVKYSPTGSVLWARRAGGSGFDIGNDLTVDAAGNCFVTGNFNGTATFGTNSLTSLGQEDLFVAKYDASGNVIWAIRSGGASSESSNGIAVDVTGNIFITGSFANGITILGNNAFNNATGYSDSFVVKLDNSGSIIWAKRNGGPSSVTDTGSDIAVDNLGNALVTGYFGNTATFGSFTLVSSANSDLDMFLAKYDTNGNVLWVKKAGSAAGWDRGADLVVDSNGNSYVTGQFFGQVSFGSTLLTSSGDADIFLAKYDSGGNEVWAKKAGGAAGQDSGNGIALDNNGNLYIAGGFNGQASFDSYIIRSDGFIDIFIAKFDALGNVLWAKQAGGDYHHDIGFAIAVDGSGNTFITGSFNTRMYFDGVNLATPTSSPSNTDIFIAKLGNTVVSCVTPTATISSTCTSTSQNLTFTLTGQQPWRIYYTRNGTAQVAYANASPFTLPVTVGGTITYALTGVSSGNCFTATTGSVVLTPLITPQVTGSTGCPGSKTLTATGATGTSTYRWYTDATITTPIAGVTSGTYTTPALTATTTYYVSVVNAGGCEGPRVAVTATINPVPTVDAGPGQTVCTNSSPFALTGYSPAGGTWSGPGISASGTFTPNVSLSGTQTLTYSVTQGGCTGTATTTVTVNPTPPTPSVMLIAPDSLMSSVMGTSYEWRHNGIVVPVITRKIQANATGTYAVRVTGPNNCISAYSPDYSFVATGIKEVNNTGISIYPNPTKGIINLKIEAHHAAQIVVYNALGQQVLKSNSVRNGYTPLDLSKEAKGIYFIQITSEDKSTTHKILVQ